MTSTDYTHLLNHQKPKTAEENEELLYKCETVNKKQIQLQISRNKSKDFELIYKWLSKKR